MDKDELIKLNKMIQEIESLIANKNSLETFFKQSEDVNITVDYRNRGSRINIYLRGNVVSFIPFLKMYYNEIVIKIESLKEEFERR